MEELLIIIAVLGMAAYFAYQLILSNPETSRLVAFVALGLVGSYAFVRLAVYMVKQMRRRRRDKTRRASESVRRRNDAVRQVLSLAKRYGGTLTAAQLHAESNFGLDESRHWLEHARNLGEAYTEPGERGVVIYVFPGLFPKRLAQTSADDSARTRIYNLVQGLKGRSSARVQRKAVEVSKTIFEFLPRVHNVVSSDYEVYTIKQVALDYFPTLLENYLQLAPSYAQSKPISDGQTAEAVLESRLDLLAKGTQEMLENLHHNDAQALLKT
ncbi:MAG: hypothetical protein AAF708_03605, partial [Deinococcota bacterium]